MPKDVPKDYRPISHDSINAEIEQSGHFIGRIDGPNVNLNPTSMRSFDEPLVDHGDRSMFDRNLGAQCSAANRRSDPQRGDAPRRQRRTRTHSEQRGKPSDSPIAKRSDANPLQTARATDRRYKTRNGAIGLAVDVDTQIRPGAKNLLEHRHR